MMSASSRRARAVAVAASSTSSGRNSRRLFSAKAYASSRFFWRAAAAAACAAAAAAAAASTVLSNKDTLMRAGSECNSSCICNHMQWMKFWTDASQLNVLQKSNTNSLMLTNSMLTNSASQSNRSIVGSWNFVRVVIHTHTVCISV